MRTLIFCCLAIATLPAWAVEDFYRSQLNDLRKNVVIDTVARVLNYSDGLPDEGNQHSFWYAHDANNCVYRKAGYHVRVSPDLKTITYDVDENQKEINLNFFAKKSIQYQSTDLRYPINGRMTKRVAVIADGREIFSAEGIQPERIAKGWSLIYSKYCTGSSKEF